VIFLKIFSLGQTLTSHQQLHHPLNRHVQGVDLFHLGYSPRPTLTMPAHLAPLVAGLAQGDHGVLAVLFDVVGVAWALLVADRAIQLLYQ
jgi:hypothetical protein